MKSEIDRTEKEGEADRNACMFYLDSLDFVHFDSLSQALHDRVRVSHVSFAFASRPGASNDSVHASRPCMQWF